MWTIDAVLRGRCWRLWLVSWMSPFRWPWSTLPVWGKMEPLWLWTLWNSSTVNQVRLSYSVSNNYCTCLFSHAPKQPCWLLIKVKNWKKKMSLSVLEGYRADMWLWHCVIVLWLPECRTPSHHAKINLWGIFSLRKLRRMYWSEPSVQLPHWLSFWRGWGLHLQWVVLFFLMNVIWECEKQCFYGLVCNSVFTSTT